MQVSRVGSPRFHALVLPFFCFWGLLLGRFSTSAASSTSILPRPTLKVKERSVDSVNLTCQAPRNGRGVVFELFQETHLLTAVTLRSPERKVEFMVKLGELDPEKPRRFCCLYKNQNGTYSHMSPYLSMDYQNVYSTTISPSYPAPLLSVEPQTGVVKYGDTLSFTCKVPTPSSQVRSLSPTPTSILLLRESKQAGDTSVILNPQAHRLSASELPGVFTVGPVSEEDEGEYTCLYQVARRRGSVNSTVSNVIRVSIINLLPAPSLVLQQKTDVWHLLCIGSAAYPGAAFTLFLADHNHPVSTRRAQVTQHKAAFPLPVQEATVASYQCQYSVLLGSMWSHSERSPCLSLTKGMAPSVSAGIDWPLVLGSISAVVLFLWSLGFLLVMAQKKVKAAVEKRKNRQDTQFWTKVHGRDHVVDLTLRRTSFTFQEWTSGDTETARPSLWNPVSTFTTQH